MNIAQQLITSLPGRENDSIPDQFEPVRIRSFNSLKEMEDKFYLSIVEQRNRFILFVDGSKICYYRDPDYQLNDDFTGNMAFPDILFWTVDKKQVENPRPPRYEDSDFRFWVG